MFVLDELDGPESGCSCGDQGGIVASGGVLEGAEGSEGRVVVLLGVSLRKEKERRDSTETKPW